MPDEKTNISSLSVLYEKMTGLEVAFALLGLIISLCIVVVITEIIVSFWWVGANWYAYDSQFQDKVTLIFYPIYGVYAFSSIMLAFDLIKRREKRFIIYIIFPPAVFLTLFSKNSKPK